jgi:serine/threonine protein kinase
MDFVKEIWKDLQKLGFPGTVETFADLFKWLRKIHLVYEPPRLKKINKENFSVGPVTLSHFAIAMNGNFGTMYAIERIANEKSEVAFLKSSPKHPNSLFLEAILQTIGHSVLSYYGFPRAVPRVLDLVRHPEYGIVFTVEKVHGGRLLSDYLKDHIQWGKSCQTNDKLVLTVIAQVASYMAILESTIGFNHRDLKGTNVLMIAPCEPYKQTILLDELQWTLSLNCQAVLVDFGFACIGKSDRQTIVSAGEHLPKIDFCPKEGRDLFFFFATLWNVPAFRASTTPAVTDLFHKWLQDTSRINWADWLITSACNNLESMLLLTNASHFKSEPCSPLSVLRDITVLYPEIVKLK